jgi:hypothetical protein
MVVGTIDEEKEVEKDVFKIKVLVLVSTSNFKSYRDMNLIH